jgi:DNA-binding transcriptional ArsR family regulator
MVSRKGAAIGGAAPLFAALGDPTRLRLVARLCEGGPQSIVRLTEGMELTRQGVTKHLRVLGDAGLVRGTRRGRESLWTIEPKQIDVARSYLDLMSHRWDERLARLEKHVTKARK